MLTSSEQRQKHRAKPGDRVRVHYTGTLSDGRVFDSSYERGPVEFTLGCGQILSGFERAVYGKTPGSVTIENVPSHHAFGQKRTDRILRVPAADLNGDGPPRIGKNVEFCRSDGSRVGGVVTEIDGHEAIVDTNHPLAGEDLTFEIEILEIVSSHPVRETPAVPSGARESRIFT